MSSTRNWGMIRSGETFEALATTIIFFEDSGAILLGRRGKDGGQDARSADGATVYQAKHHQNPTAAKAIADAKREVSKIAKYRQPGQDRYDQWVAVSNWVLITNATFNTTDHQTWETEVVPLFHAHGLVATYWEQAKVDGYLTQHPAIDRAFFQNENRVFLSPPEACRGAANKDYFTRRNELAPYVGRKSELATLDEFLASDKRFLQVHAAGGVGKTRFLLEAACEVAGRGDWQVFWANVATMEASSTWFEAIAPERPTLLVIDEPKDERLVELLHEQLGSPCGRAQEWKIAIAVRSSNDPVLRALQHPQVKLGVDELLLQPLDRQECEQVCLELMESGNLASTTPQAWRKETAKTLASRFTGYPVWLTLAVHLLEADGSLAKLPDTAKDLCEFYIGQALKSAPAKARDVLRWVALLGTVNREDASQLDALATETGVENSSEIDAILERLVSSRLLRVWGAHDRLTDVKPDVLRDHILREWLVHERSYGAERLVPSKAAAELTTQLTVALASGEADHREERILEALARTDFLLGYAGKQVRLAAPVFARLDGALSDMSAAKRVALVETLKEVGAYYPEEMLQLLSRMRQEPAADETIEGHWKTRTFTQDDVLRELPDVYHHLARGMLTDEQALRVMEELLVLVLEGQRLFVGQRPNDGNRAGDVVRNLLENGPSYYREFGDVAADVVLHETELDSIESLTVSKLRALRAIVEPLCKVQRHQTWAEGFTFHLRDEVLPSGHPSRRGRQSVLERLKTILQQHGEQLSGDARCELWDMVSEAHREANYAKGRLSDLQGVADSELTQLLLDDLRWAKSVLTDRTATPREWRCARTLWHWHADHAEGEFQELAKELESLYFTNPTVSVFEYLTERMYQSEGLERAETKARELATSGVTAIESFLSDAQEFFGDKEVSRVHGVSGALGRVADECESARKFILDGLTSARHGSAAYEFVMSAVSVWVFTRRHQNASGTAALVIDLLEKCEPDTQLEILWTLYGASYAPSEALRTSVDEWNLVRSKKALYVEAKAFRQYVACTLWGLQHNWPELSADLDELLGQATPKQRNDVVHGLVERLHYALADGGSTPPPDGILRWLWNRLSVTDDLDGLRHEKRWCLDEITNRLGKVPLHWMVDAVGQREAAHNAGHCASVGSLSDLRSMVQLVDSDNASDPEVRNAVVTLMAMLESSQPPSGLAKLLTRIDPNGLLVPQAVAVSLRDISKRNGIERLSRIACYYTLGSPEWRQIARAAFKACRHLSAKERERIYDAVSETGRWSYYGPAGQVPTVFTAAVEAAQRGRDEETEKDFKPFWEWRLNSAKVRVHLEEERLKEEVWD